MPKEFLIKMLCFIVLASLAGCKQSAPSKSEIFQDYLIEKHNTVIPDSSHYFIIVPGFGCIGCYEAFIPILITELQDVRNNVSFIVSRREFLNDSIFANYRFLPDKNRFIDYQALDIANITVIETKQSIIRRVFHLNTKSEMSDFLKVVRQLNQNHCNMQINSHSEIFQDYQSDKFEMLFL